MGGFGSGRGQRPRRGGSRETVEGSSAIRLPEWRTRGLLDPGLTVFTYGPFRCTRHGDTVEIEWYNREGGRCSDTVRLASRPHGYGQQTWFVCPGGCEPGTVDILYLKQNYLRCRRCHQLVYQSSREPWYDRGIMRVQKIQRRLGGLEAPIAGFPARPSYMHHATYERWRQTYLRAEQRMTMIFWIRLKQLDPWRPSLRRGRSRKATRNQKAVTPQLTLVRWRSQALKRAMREMKQRKDLSQVS
jgi:hypothetical protein